MHRVLGQCSLCGGNVVQEDTSYSTSPRYEPYCVSCHAVKRSNLPVIDMVKNDNITVSEGFFEIGGTE